MHAELGKSNRTSSFRKLANKFPKPENKKNFSKRCLKVFPVKAENAVGKWSVEEPVYKTVRQPTASEF